MEKKITYITDSFESFVPLSDTKKIEDQEERFEETLSKLVELVEKPTVNSKHLAPLDTGFQFRRVESTVPSLISSP